MNIAKKEPDSHVRKIMSESIKDSDDIPREIVMIIAEDEAVVAVPILQFSKVLTDDNLIYIIKNTEDVSKEEGISKRETVSGNVCDALIDKDHESVVVTLLENKGASITYDGYERILNNYSQKKVVIDIIMQRPQVPAKIIQFATKAANNGNDADIANNAENELEFNNFLNMARAKGVKDDLIPIFALCKGSLRLYELCVARKMHVPTINIKRVLEVDDTFEKFDVIYDRAELPDGLRDATRILYMVLKDFENEFEVEKGGLSEYNSKRVINNMMMLSEDIGGIDNLEFVISLVKLGVIDITDS